MYYNNKRLARNIFWVVLGAVLLGFSIAGILDSSIYAGMGGGLMAVGILRIVLIVKYRKDAGYREKVDTEVSDERSKFLRMKSWSWTGYIVMLTTAVGAVAAMILGQQTVQLMLSYAVCLIITVYWIVFLILSKKY